MFKVQMIGDPRTFFTDRDPSQRPRAGIFNEVKQATFNDSYQPVGDWKSKRERDAREALETGATIPVRINFKAVAKVTVLV